MNTEDRVMTLYPYWYCGQWVFDDERTGLKEEAFVRGASEMISRLVGISYFPHVLETYRPKCTAFALSFSDKPFTGHQVQLDWFSFADGGNWYTGEVGGKEMECWLCPALFHYFDRAPLKLFAKASKLPFGVDPIWHVPSGQKTKQYMAAERG